ncbi:hypothetical protein GKZ90_0018440 [Flavobacterium sp. MC2016-06]|jgi:hypothetical protein|uniref:hypothetical protein n=1 Tax=Flavobacterium sp. MC2016-06 TaxID=2676308 RepID=UPI0018ACE274|nr:hypothetical protein [Flavobacterium sp. MC2016-06]MBU3858441.1 hypothetical protein [Flavobacterium sp. MC2016-06]
MQKIIKTICSSLFLFSIVTNAQTLTATQQQNARATGYAIVAAKNPGKSFAVYMIKWDGIHDLEYNANNQINYMWHPQAVIKGNYFDQAFSGNDFSMYSSVIVSQTEFDIYKNTGSDWWIVCSNLPSFNNSSISLSDNGNLGIGIPAPAYKLDVLGSTGLGSESVNANTTKIFLRNPVGKTWAISSGANMVTESSFSIYNWTDNQNSPYFHIDVNGNIGIGTFAPDTKLAVNGTIHTKEVKVDMNGWSDFVFKKNYPLPTLEEVEKHISEKGHLENIPSEEEVLKNGINLGEMNIKLLQKIEELTLYSIEQNKKISIQKKESETQSDDIKQLQEKINVLEKQNEFLLEIEKRLNKIEKNQKNK